jgi:hypothetical protein
MRWLRFLVLGILALISSYVVAANAFLSLGGVQAMFDSTDQVKVDFRRAWSFWPGHVHAEGLRVTMQDRNVQFVLQIPSADVVVQLAELSRRTFHATSVRASGIVFRFRHRIQPESASLPYVAAYPPIPGFEDPPLRESGPPPPPLDEANYDLWTVHVEDVNAGVNDLWAQMFRYVGEARVRGAFRLRPAKRLWVGPAELDFSGGTITTGGFDVLHDVTGKLSCTVDDFDTETSVGLEPFRDITSRLVWSAEVANLEGANFLLGSSAPVVLEHGSGHLDADVAIDHGILTPDSRISYETRRIGMKKPFEGQLRGTLRLTANVTRERRARVALEAEHVQVSLARRTARPLEVARAVATLAADNVDVTREWPFSGARAAIRDAALDDLAWMNDLPIDHPSSWSLDGGRGHLDAEVVISKQRDIAAWLEVGLQKVGVRAGNGACPWANVASASLHADLETSNKHRHVRVRGDLKQLSFRWGDFSGAAAKSSVTGSYEPTGAKVHLQTTGLRLKNAGGPPRGWQTEAASLVLDTAWTRNGGRVGLEIGDTRSQVGRTRLVGNLAANLRVTSADASHRTADVSGSVRTTDVAIESRQRSVSGWWATFDLDRVHVDARQDFDFNGKLHARLRDGLPALYALASEDEIPKWLPGLVPLERMTLDLQVERFCRWADVQIMEARGGPLVAAGRVQVEPGDTRGAILVRLAAFEPIAFGLHFVEDYSNAEPFAGNGWLEQHLVPLTSAATEKHDTRCVPQAPKCP